MNSHGREDMQRYDTKAYVGVEEDTKVIGRQRHQTMRGEVWRQWKRGAQERGEDKKVRSQR